MSDLRVNLPLSRLKEVAKRLGSQDVDACPSMDGDCWEARGLKGYFDGDPVEHECSECWLLWLLTGA